MELSTVIVPESKTLHASLTMIGSIKVLELTEILVGSLITFEILNTVYLKLCFLTKPAEVHVGRQINFV